jgi:hypothetical protein
VGASLQGHPREDHIHRSTPGGHCGPNRLAVFTDASTRDCEGSASSIQIVPSEAVKAPKIVKEE